MSLPVKDKKPKVPSFDEVMQDDYKPPKVPSYDEIMDEKKNPSENASQPTANNTNSVSETPSSEKEPIPIVTDYGNGEVINPKDPFAMAKAANEFSKRTIDVGVTGESSEVLPDEKSVKASQEINKDLEKQGFKPDFAIAVNDLPDDAFNEIPKEELVSLYKENPLKFKQITNELKTRNQIRQGAYDVANDNIPEGKDKEYLASQQAIIESNDYNINEIATPETMDDLRGMMAIKQQNINRNIKDEDTKKKLQERLRDTYASTINANSLNLKEEYDNSDVKNIVDINQYAGLETLRIFDPAKYENYKNIIQKKITPLYSVEVNISPEERQRINTPDSAFAAKNKGTVSPLTISEQIGQETVLRELNAIGLGNAAENLYSQRSDIIADQNKMIKESERKDITPEELGVLKLQFDESVKKVNDIQTKIGELEKSEKLDDARYPQTAQLKFDAQVKEMVKDDGESVGAFMWNKFGHSMSSSVDAIENILVSNFGSKDDKAALSMKRIGEQQKFDAKTYLPENERRINSPVIMEFDEGLKKEIKKVLNGRDLGDLSTTERNQLIELVKNNQDKIKTITNPEAGKSKNFLSKATIMTVAGFTSEIAGFMTKMALLRGAGVGAKTAEAEVLFMDGYNHSVQQKLSEGASMDEANSYGILHGAILSTMVQFGSKFEAVKKIMAGGKSPLSKQIAGMSEETWNAIYNKNKSFIERLAKSAKGVAGEQVKMIGTFAGIAPTADAIADNVFYNADNTVGEVAQNIIEGSIDMAIGGLPLIGFGLAKGSMKTKATPIEKAALWNLGDQPTIGKLKIDEAVQKGDLTLEEGEVRKKTIDDVSKLISKVPNKTDKGKLMTDEQRSDYLFNLTVQENAKQESKDLPPKQAEKADHKAMVAEYENQIILDAPTTEKLESQKASIEKKLEPKKDAEGKAIEIPEKEKLNYEAELEAVNNELDTRKSFEKVNRLIFDRETGQPLDGSDETMAEQLIEKAISKSKDTDQANAKLDQLGYNLRGQANADFNQFVQDRIDGKTDMTFSEWKNQSENKTIQNEPIKEPASSTTQSNIEAKKADIEIGKVGNTEYEVKVDGVYYQGKKLNNPENKTHRQLIEADIERRRQGELDTPIQNFKKAKTKEDLIRAGQDWIGVNPYDSADSPMGVRSALLTQGGFEKGKELFIEFFKKADEIRTKQINAKYDAELKALEQQPTSTTQSEIEKKTTEISYLEERLKEPFARPLIFEEDYSPSQLRDLRETWAKQDEEERIIIKKEIAQKQAELKALEEQSTSAKKADIERRRQGELISLLPKDKVSTGNLDFSAAFNIGIPEFYQQMFDMVKEGKDTIAGVKESNAPLLQKLYNEGKLKDKKDVWLALNPEAVKINAKYDAELAALEKQQSGKDVVVGEGVVDKTEAKTKLEQERDVKLKSEGKPLPKLEFLSSKELVDSKDPIGNKKIHNELKDKYKRLRELIDCIWL